ncbi:MAG: siphovirus Gp157 family protein [Bdellovibrio sp.]
MENKSLVLLVNEAMQIEQMLMESGGELTEEINKSLSVNSAELAQKVDGYDHILTRFESLEKHYKARAEFFKTIATQCKAAQDRLRDNIKFAMHEMGVSEIKGNDMRFKMAPTQGMLIIEDESMVPVEFKHEIVTTEIDKKALKDALLKGELPGAKLVPGFSLRSYANTPERKATKAGA